MVFWLAVLTGALFAWNAVRIGLFNLVLAAYMAIFLSPSAIESIPAATAIPDYGFALTVMSIAIATMFFAYGTCYACLSGRFYIQFPKICDTIGAGFLGFLSGFFVLSFLTLVFSLTPLAKLDSVKSFGFDAQSQETNISYVCWWCDRLHSFVSPFGDETTGWQSVDLLLEKLSPKPPEEAKPEAVAEAPAPPPPPPPSALSARSDRATSDTGSKPVPDESLASDGNPFGGTKNVPSGEDKTAVMESSQPDSGEATTGGAFETLEEELARRHVTISSPDKLPVVTARKSVRIIEVSGTCTADKFNAEQKALLRQWVSQGGVLWANNDVLSLVGVRASLLTPGNNELTCTVSESPEVAPIVSLCKKVSLLNSAGGKARIVSSKRVLPLLVLEGDASGTACWSLVPYGRGWITDPKPVNMKRDDGDQFWQDFCRFCLGKEVINVPGGEEPTAGDLGTPPPSSNHTNTPEQSGKTLTGVWQPPTGADQFRLADDGKTVTIDLNSGDMFTSFSGTLVRREEQTFAGIVDVIFHADMSKKRYAINVTATVADSRHLRLRCMNWPVWDKRGKFMGRKSVYNEVWTRSDETTIRQPPPPVRRVKPIVVPPSW
jgi:hypothetical protein